MIVPTGVGASIGGYAGDASRYAQKIASEFGLIVNPNVVNAEDSSKSQIDLLASGGKVELDTISDSEFSRCVNDIVGYDVFSVADNRNHFTTQIARENGEMYTQYYDGKYYVWINGSDASGRDNTINIANDASDVGNGVIYSY